MYRHAQPPAHAEREKLLSYRDGNIPIVAVYAGCPQKCGPDKQKTRSFLGPRQGREPCAAYNLSRRERHHKDEHNDDYYAAEPVQNIKKVL